MNKKYLVLLVFPTLLLSGCNNFSQGEVNNRYDLLNYDFVRNNVDQIPQLNEVSFDTKKVTLTLEDTLASVSSVSSNGYLISLANGKKGLYNPVLEKWVVPFGEYSSITYNSSYSHLITEGTNSEGVKIYDIFTQDGTKVYSGEGYLISSNSSEYIVDGKMVAVTKYALSNKDFLYEVNDYKTDELLYSGINECTYVPAISSTNYNLQNAYSLAIYGEGDYFFSSNSANEMIFYNKDGNVVSSLMQPAYSQMYVAGRHIVIQSSVKVAPTSEDFTYYDDAGDKYKLETKIFNYVSGRTSTIDADYVISATSNLLNKDGYSRNVNATVRLIDKKGCLDKVSRNFILDEFAERHDDITGVDFSNLCVFGKNHFYDYSNNVVLDEYLRPLFSAASIDANGHASILEKNGCYTLVDENGKVLVKGNEYISFSDAYNGQVIAADKASNKFMLNLSENGSSVALDLTKEYGATVSSEVASIFKYVDGDAKTHVVNLKNSINDVVATPETGETVLVSDFSYAHHTLYKYSYGTTSLYKESDTVLNVYGARYHISYQDW